MPMIGMYLMKEELKEQKKINKVIIKTYTKIQ